MDFESAQGRQRKRRPPGIGGRLVTRRTGLVGDRSGAFGGWFAAMAGAAVAGGRGHGRGLGLAAGAGALDLGGLGLAAADEGDGGEQAEGDGEGENCFMVLSRCLVTGLSSRPRLDPDADRPLARRRSSTRQRLRCQESGLRRNPRPIPRPRASTGRPLGPSQRASSRRRARALLPALQVRDSSLDPRKHSRKFPAPAAHAASRLPGAGRGRTRLVFPMSAPTSPERNSVPTEPSPNQETRIMASGKQGQPNNPGQGPGGSQQGRQKSSATAGAGGGLGQAADRLGRPRPGAPGPRRGGRRAGARGLRRRPRRGGPRLSPGRGDDRPQSRAVGPRRLRRRLRPRRPPDRATFLSTCREEQSWYDRYVPDRLPATCPLAWRPRRLRPRPARPAPPSRPRPRKSVARHMPR